MWRKWAIIIGMLCCLIVAMTMGKGSNTTGRKEAHIQQLQNKKLYYDAFLAYEQLYKETKNSHYLYEQGVMAVHLKDKEGAIRLFEQVRKQQPYDRKAYDQLLALYDNKDSEEYIQLLYDMAFYFKELTPIKILENTMTPFYFKNVKWLSSHEDNIVVMVNDKYGIMSMDGSLLVDTVFDWIGPYDEHIGFYPARENGHLQYIDLNGYKRVHLDESIDDIGITSEHKRVVISNGKAVYVDNQFNVILDDHFESGGSFFNGITAVKKEGKWGVITETGKTIIPFEYDDVLFDEYKYVNKQHVIWLKTKENWQLFDETGKLLSKHNIKQVTPFVSDEPAGVKLDDGWNFITKEGVIVSNNRYLETTAFHFGHALVKTENAQWHIVNSDEEKGEAVIADTMKSFNSHKVAMYTLDNEVGYLKLFDRGKYNGVHR